MYDEILWTSKYVRYPCRHIGLIIFGASAPVKHFVKDGRDTTSFPDFIRTFLGFKFVAVY